MAHDRVVAVHRVAAAGVVEIAPRLRIEQVVGRVVEPAPAEGRAALVALAGVVEDDVEDDLDARLVQGLHHLLELAHDLAAGPGTRVRGLGGEEGHRLVAPEVAQRLAGEQVAARVVALLELRDRHQLDGGDAQLLEVRDLLDDAAEGAGVRDSRARVTREAADVDLVDHGVGERDAERLLVTPVELLVDDPRAQAPEPALGRGYLAPLLEAGHRLAVGVDQHPTAVEPEQVRRGVRLAARAKAVLDPGIDATHEDVPYVAGLVVPAVERQLEHGLALARGGRARASARSRAASRRRS